MSQENVDTARRVVDAVNRRDVETLDSLWSEEGEFNSRLAASEGHVFRGRQGIRDYFAWLDEAFGRFEAKSRRSSTQARIGSSRCSGQVCVARQAEFPSTTSFAIVFTFQGELIARADSYLSPAEALEAAGLSE
jgi:ketosteroid isomerase-like protein